MISKTFHLVVRFSDSLFGVGNVVAKHNDVVGKHGAVWFGKLGSPFSFSRIELLNTQIAESVPTFLYLVQGNWKKPSVCRAELLAVTRELPAKERKLVPAYYSKLGLLEYMRAWMKVGEIVPVETSVLNDFRAMTSALPFQDTLVRSSSGHFLVYDAKKAKRATLAEKSQAAKVESRRPIP